MQSTQLNEILSTIESELPDLKKKYHIQSIGVFGSFVKKQQDKNSDLDVLVTFNEVPGLFSFIELEHYLSSVLELKVDLVMQDALKPKIAQRVLAEVVMVNK